MTTPTTPNPNLQALAYAMENMSHKEKVECLVELETRAHIDEWLRLHKVVDFTKKRNKAVYNLYLPLAYVKARTKELEIEAERQ